LPDSAQGNLLELTPNKCGDDGLPTGPRAKNSRATVVKRSHKILITVPSSSVHMF